MWSQTGPLKRHLPVRQFALENKIDSFPLNDLQAKRLAFPSAGRHLFSYLGTYHIFQMGSVMHLLIWRGRGWLVVVMVFGFSLIANLLFDALYGNDFYNHHEWPFALSLLVSGTACWILGRRLKQLSDRVVIDKETGEELIINRSQNTLCFIPMHLYGPILWVTALVIFSVSFRNGGR